MPNISDFNAGNLAIRPSEIGAESMAAAGRRLGAFYHQEASEIEQAGSRLGRAVGAGVDAAVAYQDHRAIAAGSATGMKLFSDLEDSKSAATKNIPIDDPLYGQKVEIALKDWRETKMEPALQDWQNSGVFNTQKSADWAERHVEMLRDHLFTQTMSDISSAAGKGVVNASRTNLNEAVNVAINNPSAVDAAIAGYRHAVQGLIESSPVKGIDSAKIQEHAEENIKQIVRAGMAGVIQKSADPVKAAAAYATRYSSYIDAGEAIGFAKAAETQSKANLAYSKQIEAYNRSEQRDKVETARNETWAKNVTFDDATGKPIINPQFFKDVISIPTRFPGAPNATDTARTMLDWGEAVQNGKLDKVRTDPTVQGALTAGLFRAENPTSVTDVLKAETEQKLTHTDGTVLRELINARDEAPIKDPVFKDTIQAAKDTFTFGTNSADDPMGSKAYSAFVQKFFPEYIKELRAGTLKPNALNMRDPTSLISQSITAARPSLQHSMKTDPPRAKFVPPPGWLVNSKGEYSDPAGIIYDAEGKPTGRKINANTLPSRWPTVPISQ